MNTKINNIKHFINYANRLQKILNESDWSLTFGLAKDLQLCVRSGVRVFICGNGGSAGNANHLANDFLYGIAKQKGRGLKVISLSSNPAVITCLANDVGYEEIYSEQLAVQGQKGDLLIALSGSGNSANIINVLKQAKQMQIKSYAILGFDGGKCLQNADVPIHFPIDDMQIAEDLQIIVGHMVMQWLYANKIK